MAIDPSCFHPLNVADTCSLWNVLSSLRLYSVACDAGCSFCCTVFVLYEGLHKPRKVSSPEDQELVSRLERQHQRGSIVAYSLDVADLQDLAVLESRKRVSKGELSSIVFARKTRQAFLTDDQGARKLAEAVLVGGMTQTTPHLFGWLIFSGRLGDGDKDQVIEDHERLKRPLRKYLEEMYIEGLRCRSLSAQHSE